MKNEERKTEWWDYDGRLFNFRPCLFVFLFFCLGIFYAFCSVAYDASVWWTLLLLPIFAIAYFILKQKNVLLSICFLSLAFIVGAVSYSHKAKVYLASPVVSGEVSVSGEVVSARYYAENTQLVLTDIEIDGAAYKGKLVAYMVGVDAENVKVGDVIFTEGEIWTELALKNDFGANSFAEDIRYGLRSEKGAQVLFSRFAPFAAIREQLRNRLYTSMDEDVAAFVFAVLTGDASEMESALLENVRMGGIAHLFAVSGLHIGTLYGVCAMLAQKTKGLKEHKFLRILLIVAILLFYSAVCGFRESVVRALVGCIAAEICLTLGVKRDMTETLSIAGVFVLLINPASLFCIGFQLSFLACFGIAFLARPIQVWLERIYRRIAKDKLGAEEKKYSIGYLRGTRGKIFSFFSVTLSAQLATAPLQYSAFGYLSGWGLLLNCLLVPCVGVIFPITLAFCAAACLLPSVLSKIILFFPNIVWSLIALIFQVLDFSFVITGGAIPLGVPLCYYGALLVLSDKFNFTRDKKVAAFSVFTLCFALGLLLF
ncbi:MAG: ComEC/Rec2 family competence protein [Clostridia bacterium]|nr:ComEC/Rec2 family competence protein [Clostridia bacterium]